MKKVVILIVVLAIIWAVPPARERLGAAALPVIERLGPVGAFVLRPAREFGAKHDAKTFVKALEHDASLGRRAPEPRQFTEWVSNRLPDEDGIDPWGNAYWLQRATGSITVGSDGADGERDTDDDVLHTVPF